MSDKFQCEIREAKLDEWEDAMALAWRTFQKFEACEYTPEGVKNFLDFISDNGIRKMFMIHEYHMWVALDGNQIIGLISLRSGKHISLLFVDERYHKKGVGRALMEKLWSYLREKKVTFCTVNSSPYAVEFYHKLGFKDLDSEKVDGGIRFTPMRKDLF
ncbi:MAG: GNAT family N-acetyltransferase [Lachnospiraceae bacterium]|nr:GNAT family N-acetyltransferase [Lachnospiraceae bacterium]